MTRKEFAQAIGQKLVDSHDAIIQLYNEGHKVEAIADVLSVSKETVRIVLAEENLVPWTPALEARAIALGKRSGESDSTGETQATSRFPRTRTRTT